MDPDLYRSAQTQSGVPAFWANKYEKDALKNWDKFYKRNATNFFKDRHWTAMESTDGFPCLAEPSEGIRIVVEAGCGVANCAFPLLDVNECLFIYAFDFAPSAVSLIKEEDQYDENRMKAFLWDFFPPAKQAYGIRNLYALLKPGGRLLFRDYATGDLAQNRFASRNRIDKNYFVRQDRTLSFFFDEETLRSRMTEVGFEEIYVRRVSRVIQNRKENLQMSRVFLQAEFVKPML